MTDVMLDLETMGVGSDAAIIAIGAVEFDLHAGTLGQEFYKVVDLESSVAAGGTISPSTVLWWMKQSDAARAAFLREGEQIDKALTQFSWWVRNSSDTGVNIWGNGAAFDNVVLRTAYQRLGRKPPWDFGQDRCFRTIRAEFQKVELETTGTAHNALDDAKYQARYLIEVLRR